MTTRRNFLKTMGAGVAGIALGGVPSLASAATPNLMTSREAADAKK